MKQRGPRKRRTHGTGIGLAAALSVAALLGATSCSSGEQSGSPSANPSATKSAPAPTPDTTDADAARTLLEGTFVNMKSLGGGSGGLRPQFGDTHPAAPDNVLSVTFAFACTGGGEVALTFTVADEDVPSAKGTQVCDGSVFQQSIELPEPGSVGFTGVVTGTEDGGYAYAYYPEKEQLP
ncbi:hypothetical protein ACFCY9_27020 [Streptomyces fimicarius]|uniref:hypothetical protein n=1 Tax=Streptomyces griseus TaxID=1911 RepID=UPI0035D54C93